MDDDAPSELAAAQQRVTVLERKVRLLEEGLRQAERLRQMYDHTTRELQALNAKFEQAQVQLIQSEKMASIGLLAAGVAHEINNPVGFINSNLSTLGRYVDDFLRIILAYEQAQAELTARSEVFADVERLKRESDFAYKAKDVVALIAESGQGIERITKIVHDLKNFSRMEADEEWHEADIHHGLESTLTVIWNELKYTCDVVREYGKLPLVQCQLSQLSQVFMNLLINAAQAIETRGIITIRTGLQDDAVWVEIADTGRGIPPESLPHIFDPFFTTKPVGKGTGLGLSVSYNIIEKHHGRIEVGSVVGKGTTFRVWLPVRQQPTGGEDARKL